MIDFHESTNLFIETKTLLSKCFEIIKRVKIGPKFFFYNVYGVFVQFFFIKKIKIIFFNCFTVNKLYLCIKTFFSKRFSVFYFFQYRYLFIVINKNLASLIYKINNIQTISFCIPCLYGGIEFSKAVIGAWGKCVISFVPI